MMSKKIVLAMFLFPVCLTAMRHRRHSTSNGRPFVPTRQTEGTIKQVKPQPVHFFPSRRSESSKVPYGYITAWNSAPPFARIVFDREVTDAFSSKYWDFLNESNCLNRDGYAGVILRASFEGGYRIKNTYDFGINTSVTQEQLNLELEKANCHFELEAVALEEAREAKETEELKKQKEKEAERLKIISKLDPTKQALLKKAILLDFASNVKAALKVGANIDYGMDGQPPLLWAILLKKFSAAREILKNGANPNVDYLNHGLVHYLVAQGNLDFACVLVKYGSDSSEYKDTLSRHLEKKIHQAIMNDSAQEVRQAIELGADIEHGRDYKVPLLEAVLSKKSNAIKELLEHHVNIDIIHSGCNLVQNAMQQCDVKSALLLVRAGADSSQKGTSQPLMDMALWELATNHFPDARNQYFEFLRELINRGYNLNSGYLMSRTMIVFAKNPVAKIQCFEFLRELISHGYDLNDGNCNRNALYNALCGYPEKELLEFFIKNGANPNKLITIDQRNSWTPLFNAINISDVQKSMVAVKVLLDAGADINKKASPDSVLQTPLFFAIKKHGNDGVVDLLIERGAGL